MREFYLQETIEDNLLNTSLDKVGNLTFQNKTILKKLPNGEWLEHLGYFHALSRELKLPYEPVLNKFKEHHIKLAEKKENV